MGCDRPPIAGHTHSYCESSNDPPSGPLISLYNFWSNNDNKNTSLSNLWTMGTTQRKPMQMNKPTPPRKTLSWNMNLGSFSLEVTECYLLLTPTDCDNVIERKFLPRIYSNVVSAKALLDFLFFSIRPNEKSPELITHFDRGNNFDNSKICILLQYLLVTFLQTSRSFQLLLYCWLAWNIYLLV